VHAVSVRTRVAIAAAVSILVASAVLGAGVLVFARRDIASSRDRALRTRAVAVVQLAVTAPALVTRPGALETPLAGRGTSVEIVDRRGAIVARSSALITRPLPAVAALRATLADGRPRYATVRLGDDRLRMLLAPLPDSAAAPLAGGAAIVAAPTAEDDRTLARLRAVVLVAGLLGAVLAAAAATLLTRRALRPLTSLSAAAAEIAGTRDAAQRLPETATRDEVGQLSAALNRMLVSLERAQDAERRFVGDVSHELRTPLTALRGNAEHAARHGADPELLADIAADAERLAVLVDDLLALARQDAGGPPPDVVHLDDLAHEAGETEPRVHVTAPAPVAVRGDRDALARALANLVDNALCYGPADGPVEVAVERAGGEARLTVRDAGPGPAAAEASRLFERFYRGERGEGRPGSGLGLAIVKATAERHGGHVEVVGSRFAIVLPALTEASETAAIPREDPASKGFR
jgi:signal transduction histidine kinase